MLRSGAGEERESKRERERERADKEQIKRETRLEKARSIHTVHT
tara:strand:+ start:390 stop:521 length:132 start_codon:yes stop_codon:yes gene_type:complete